MTKEKLLQLIKVWHPDLHGNTQLNNLITGMLIRELHKITSIR